MDALREGFSIGIEEEYLLVDPETRALSVRQPSGFMARCKELLGPRVAHEVLQSQIEIVSRVCANIGEARAEILELRRVVAETAQEHGMRMIAASTHPWAHWSEQVPVEMDRYRILAAEHQSLARRMSICGMHVHAGIEDPNLRIDLMSQVSYFMPHLLALSTSSPFWEGHDTGLKAFRPIIIGDLPRARACRRPSRAGTTGPRCSTTSPRPAWSPTPPRSGGTCAPPPGTRRSRSASATSAPGPRTG